MIKAARQAHLPTPPLWRNFKRWGFERGILVDAKIHFDETDSAKAQAFVERGEGSRFDGTRKNILMGKLGEIAFAKFLFAHGKALWTKEILLADGSGRRGWAANGFYLTMEEVYVRPRLRLYTSEGETVDVKTSQRDSIGVSGDRKPSYYSNYYVGVQISPDWKAGTIRGFVGLPGLSASTYIVPDGFERDFESLVDIGKLLEMMPVASDRP